MTSGDGAGEALIQLDAVAVGYGRRFVLRDVSMGVRPGEFWFLLGPNGTGKSTLIKLVLGVLDASAGHLQLHEQLDHRRQIGFIPQRAGYSDAMPTTVREFVSLGLVGLAVPRSQRHHRVDEALRQVDMMPLVHHDFWMLSGGQQQRALVARALVRQPRLLIVDEPTNGLDPVAEEALLTLLADLNRRSGLTLLFVSHDLATAARYGTHAALFHSGGIKAGLLDQVLTPANLRDCFGLPLSLDRHDGAVTVQMGEPREPR
jgi:zinc transport system ATP-binding protein